MNEYLRSFRWAEKPTEEALQELRDEELELREDELVLDDLLELRDVDAEDVDFVEDFFDSVEVRSSVSVSFSFPLSPPPPP